MPDLWLRRRAPLALLVWVATCAGLRADVPVDPAPLGAGLGGIAYWSRGLFANTMFTGHEWLDSRNNTFGTSIPTTWEHPQFDPNGYPRYLESGQRLRCLLWPFSATPADRPPGWPRRDREGRGLVVLTWQGNADIRLTGAAFQSASSNGPATGSLVDGRRVYLNTAGNLPSLTVEAVNPANPVRDIKVWLPDPADPDRRSLEGQFWHPNFLARLRDLPFGHLRVMDLGETNQSPQQEWSDRRRPSHRTMRGVLHPRAPAPGASGNRGTGLAWEYLVDLANTLDRDLWICVPHLATDDYVTQLAQLIRFGSDGVNPYTAPTAAPRFAPLAAHRRIWVEYSNEIWSNGNSFPQGDWAQAEAARLGLSKAEFNARRAAQIWSLFQQVFGGSERVVRVAAIFTANASYSEPFLREIQRYGPTLAPAVTADVVAPTTYFGNGIQDWVYERALQERRGPNRWFLTAADFTAGAVTRPVSVPANDPYWTSPKLSADLAAALHEWKRRVFSGSSAQGAGPDATGRGGGFDDTLAPLVRGIFGRNLPLISYEGGPSLYTDNRDGADPRDDGLTTFIEALNRRHEFQDLYALHLNLAHAKGLRSHTLFVDVSAWGKFGQWGHLEYPDQAPADAPKWEALRNHTLDMRLLRPVLDPRGRRPRFETPPRLPAGVHGEPYTADLVAVDGDVAPGRTLQFSLVSSLLDPGLLAAPAPDRPGTFRLRGRPLGNGTNYLLLRVHDEDGDAAWRIFQFEVGGGPGVLVQSRFDGAAPSASLPWRATYAVAPGLEFSGWQFGAGVQPRSANDALAFTTNAPAEKAQSTLALAVADREFLACTLTPAAGSPLDLRRAVIRFSIRRDSYHAPRAWALFSSVGGWEPGNVLFTSPENTAEGEVTEYAATLPDTPEFAAVSAPFELRVVPFAGQYSGHPAALVGFQIGRAGAVSGWGTTVPPTSGSSRLINLSARGRAGPGADALIGGFVLSGPAPKRVLVRGAGPSLRALGVADAIGDARLSLYAGQELRATNDGWDRGAAAAALARASSEVGAFPFAPQSRDAALLIELPPGLYSAHVAPGAGAAPGSALLEIYDADSASPTRLANLSARSAVGPGAEALIAGFVVAGTGGSRLLLRGIGPGLAPFGVEGPLPRPQLHLYRDTNLEEANQGWAQHPAQLQLTALAGKLGAFALVETAADTALAAWRSANRYTVHLSPADAGRGIALLEIYDDRDH